MLKNIPNSRPIFQRVYKNLSKRLKPIPSLGPKGAAHTYIAYMRRYLRARGTYTATLVAGFRTRSNLEIVTDLTNNVFLGIRKFRLSQEPTILTTLSLHTQYIFDENLCPYLVIFFLFKTVSIFNFPRK